MSARGIIASSTRRSCRPSTFFEQRALVRRHVARRLLERVLDVLAHRGRRQSEQRAQPIEQIAGVASLAAS